MINVSRKRTFDYDVLYNLYIEENLSALEVGKSLKSSNNTVLRELHKLGLFELKKEKNNIIKDERLYRIYQGMKQRCNNPNNIGYKYYGNKGIKLCDKWENSFTNFYNWAINNGYNENKTIERLDNNKGYNPNNCKWIKLSEQPLNKSDNLDLIYKDNPITVSEISDITGLNQRTIRSRIDLGWSIDKIINTPRLSQGDYSNPTSSVSINQLDLEGNIINTFNSIKQASEETNTSYYGISGCVRGINKTSGGFKWEYNTSKEVL